jgi:hypothetical protein
VSGCKPSLYRLKLYKSLGLLCLFLVDFCSYYNIKSNYTAMAVARIDNDRDLVDACTDKLVVRQKTASYSNIYIPLVISIAEVYIATIYKQFKCYCIQLYTDTPTCKWVFDCGPFVLSRFFFKDFSAFNI